MTPLAASALVKFGMTQLVIQLASWSFLPPTMPLVAMVRFTGAPPGAGAVPDAEAEAEADADPEPPALPGALAEADPDGAELPEPAELPDAAAVEDWPPEDWLDPAGEVPELLPPPEDELQAVRVSAIAAPAANTVAIRRLVPM